MAHFYGSVQGTRGEATRLGTKASGLNVYAAGWDGAVSVRLTYNEATGKNVAEVWLCKHRGSGVDRLLSRCNVDGSSNVRLLVDKSLDTREGKVIYLAGTVVPTIPATNIPQDGDAIRLWVDTDATKEDGVGMGLYDGEFAYVA